MSSADAPDRSAELDMGATRKAVKKLLAEYKIGRVVVVDDALGIPTWRSLLSVLHDDDIISAAEAARVEAVDADDVRAQVDAGLDAAQEAALEGALLEKATSAGVELALAAAEPALAVLKDVFGEKNIELLHPDEWADKSRDLIAQAERKPVLFLVDYQIGVDRSGLDLVKPDVQAQHPGCRFFVLTAFVTPNSEFEAWSEMAAAHGLELADFGVISKAHLAEDSLLSFARMLKMSLGARALLGVRDSVCAAFLISASAAVERIKAVRPAALAEIVFQSSDVEGQWEADTLLRLLRVALDESLQSEVHLLDSVAEGVREARRAAIVDVGTDPSLLEVAAEFQSTERYQPAAQVNGYLAPLGNGDIFHVGTDTYVLVGQPCDIALRSDGSRTGDGSHQILLRVRFLEQAPAAASLLLPHFSMAPTGLSAYAILVRPIFVPTMILELCTFHEHGRAEYTLGESLPPQRSRGADRRAKRLANKFDDLLNSAMSARAQLASALLASFFPAVDHPKVVATLDLDVPNVSYAVERIGRIRERPAENVLTAYGLATSRSAEAHDLARIR